MIGSRRNLLRSVGGIGLALGLDKIFPRASRRGLALTAASDSASAAFAPNSPFVVTLTDIAPVAGLNSVCVSGDPDIKRWIVETTGCGIAFFDYDNDGWQDIFQVSATTLDISGTPDARTINPMQAPQAKIANPKSKIVSPTCHLYHNNRDGTFTDITVKAGLARTGWGQGMCIGDYDNDGWDDLFVTYWGQNVLFHNNGDGSSAVSIQFSG